MSHQLPRYGVHVLTQLRHAMAAQQATYGRYGTPSDTHVCTNIHNDSGNKPANICPSKQGKGMLNGCRRNLEKRS